MSDPTLQEIDWRRRVASFTLEARQVSVGKKQVRGLKGKETISTLTQRVVNWKDEKVLPLHGVK